MHVPGRCLALLLTAVCTWQTHASDASFRLTATAANWATYFPGQLGNGYASTLTGPRGTEGNLGFLAGLMDYTPGDVSRPAAVPGWSAIDYSTGPSHAGTFWLNQVDLSPARFRDYQQVLDMYDGTLSTSYRYVDGHKATQIEVTSLVSQAAPHLAATQLALTPDFDGDIELSFPLDLWAPHQPRFAMATLDGPSLMEALAANQQRLQAQPPDRADRAAVWYAGDTQVLAADGDVRELTLWLDGRAAHGARMAQAVAVSLPAGLTPRDVTLYRSDYKLSLDMRVPVRKGQRYVFHKIVALSREGWGGDAKENRALAMAARRHGFDALLAEHRAAWHALWQSDIVIDGDARAQQIVHSDLYYLLVNAAPDTAWPIGACGMTPGYTGHVFWDSDSWVFPALLLLHPERARSLAMFRSHGLPQAQQRARARGLRGAMYPWEADPDNGSSQTPHSAQLLDEREIHVNADIAIAQWQYFLATHDRRWLADHGWPVIRAVADFWVSRASPVVGTSGYAIEHVASVDEDYNDVPNDTFTNLSARKALQIADAAARELGAASDPQWRKVAHGLVIPFDAQAGHHLDFDASVPHDIDSWGGSSLPMLSYPSLDVPMDPSTRRRNYAYAIAPIEGSSKDPNSMGFTPLSIAASTAGDPAAAADWFQRNLTAKVLKPPFNVRTETAGNNTGYFTTASGGFLQNLLYGFTGLRLQEPGLVEAYEPMLPAQWRAMTLRHVALRGEYLDITLERDAYGKVILHRMPSRAPTFPETY
ncbi:glycoside hydrolase family 65 protein [Dyella sp. ASV21]|uniref:glycoside hydrolase family 65 protein n=1 Tax=Dyella sp. ASV21 TaxID=2795114 RepID=UPI0018EDD173|nr:glycoside hydrolase family 65 protein [Dyella sp. ASV21]